jgi:hypothetical protein
MRAGLTVDCQNQLSSPSIRRATRAGQERSSGWQQRVDDARGDESGRGIVEYGHGPCGHAGKACMR